MSALLETLNLTKRFGGLAATDRVNLKLFAGEIHALIGPNGAGKTTLLSQLSGSVRGDGGQILLDGADITHVSPHERVARGIVRSYQVTSVFKGFTAIDNVALAVQARSGPSFRFWRPAAAESRLREEARQVLVEVGLETRAAATAGNLAHGEQRQLEIALALATRPKLLLLDEPMAGMGAEEAGRMIELIARLKSRLTILLVEHDMDAVFRLADRVSVMVSGRLIASGTPAEIKANRDVRYAYLGEAENKEVAA